MVTIYCIEDCNSLKYVGSTKEKLNRRLTKHKHDKKRNNGCSSEKIDLDNCKIYSLETCNESNRTERERYWINHIDCVNEQKLNFDFIEYQKAYYTNNKEKRKMNSKNNYEKRVIKKCLDDIINEIELFH